MLTLDVMKKNLPKRIAGTLGQDQVDLLNEVLEESDARHAIRDNILGFTSVLNAPHYSLKDYVHAVKYITFTMMGDTNIRAWSKVFPDRYTRLREKGTPDKDINAHVRHYNKTKLVNEIRDQALVPSYLLNADKYQEAINIQAKIMSDENVSPKVRSDAANSLLTHLKRPETQQISVNVGVQEGGLVQELKDITMGLAAQQRNMIEQGAYSVQETSKRQIVTVDGSAEEV